MKRERYGKVSIVPISRQTEEQIRFVLDEFRAAYAARDADAVIALVMPDYTGYRSGAGGRIEGAEAYRRELERDFARCEALAMELSALRINAEGTVAWTCADCTITATVGGREVRSAGRMTAVLRGDGRTWRLAQSHISLPVQGRQLPGC